jgi:hypothetical protein
MNREESVGSVPDLWGRKDEKKKRAMRERERERERTRDTRQCA